MSNEESELLSRAVAGDGDGLSELLLRIGPQVQARLDGRLASRYRGAFDLDDVMQVTYLEAFLRVKEFSPEGVGSFVAWLGRIAENNLLDAIRELDRGKRPPRRRQVTPRKVDDSYATLFGDLAGTGTTPSRGAARSEVKAILEDALSKLPAEYEAAVRKLDLEGVAVAEAAASMNRSKGAVHMLRAQADGFQ